MEQKQRIVIIGAGLAGCLLASKLAKNHEVILIYSEKTPSLRWKDHLTPAIRSLSGGLGGSTLLWHNALMEIEQTTLRNDWLKPLKLDHYIKEAAALFGLSLERERKQHEVQKKRISKFFKGNKIRLGQPLFVPKNKINAATFLNSEDIQILKQTIVNYKYQGNTITHAVSNDGEKIKGDIFVDCTGGIGNLSTLRSLISHSKSLTYEEHLCGFLGHVSLKKNIGFDFFLNKAQSKGWHTRYALEYKTDEGWSIALYLRPHYRAINQNYNVSLDNFYRYEGSFSFKKILRLLFTPSRIAAALFTKFGIYIPTKTFSIYAVYQHPTAQGRIVQNTDDVLLQVNHSQNLRRYTGQAFEALTHYFGNHLNSSLYDDKAPDRLTTGAHFSSSIPIGNDSQSVSNTLQLNGYKNIYVCSGAVLPETSYANTGLTIVALALRLADQLSPKESCIKMDEKHS